MKALATLTDPVYIPRENFTWYDKLWLRIMNDKRDLPFIYLLTVIHLIGCSGSDTTFYSAIAGLVVVAGSYTLFLCFTIIF